MKCSKLGRVRLFLTAPCRLRAQRNARGVKALGNELAKTSDREADYARSVMSAVFNHSIQYGDITTNPCSLGGNVYSGTPRGDHLDVAQIGAFRSVRQYAHMHLPLLIGLRTGRREGDKGRRKQAQPRRNCRHPGCGAAEGRARRRACPAQGAKVSPLSIEDEAIWLTTFDNPWREGRLQRTHFELSRGQAGGRHATGSANKKEDDLSDPVVGMECTAPHLTH